MSSPFRGKIILCIWAVCSCLVTLFSLSLSLFFFFLLFITAVLCYGLTCHSPHTSNCMYLRDEEIDDIAAICFAKTFYDALLNSGRTVQSAFDEACHAVANGVSEIEKNKFLLLPQPSPRNDTTNSDGLSSSIQEGLHDKYLDIGDSDGGGGASEELIEEEGREPETNCKFLHTRNMIGRNQQVAEVYKYIHHDENRIVLIVGNRQIGKTEVYI
jgi:hypothetical protein